MSDKAILHNPVFRVGGNDTEPGSYVLKDFSGLSTKAILVADDTITLNDSENSGGLIVATLTKLFTLISELLFPGAMTEHHLPKFELDGTLSDSGYSYSVLANIPSSDQIAALNAANAPSASNALVTMADISDPAYKGWYPTELALNTAYPTADDGDHAIVGATDTIWTWDSDTTAWVNSGSTAAVASVNGYTGVVVLVKSDIGLGNVANILNKYDGTDAPTVDNDTTEGYSVGSRWINVTNDKVYDCVDATEGAAVWNEVGAGTGGAADGDQNILATRIFN